MRALLSAASGMAAQQTRLDGIANNLANVSTTGFKKSRESFADLLYQELSGPREGDSASRIEVGSGVRLAAMDRDSRAGELKATGNPLDVAIDGDAWFVVEDEGGRQMYTRDGAFHPDADGRLVTASGLVVAGDIAIPEGTEQLTILGDGTVQARLAGDTRSITLGSLQLARFVNPSGLEARGGNVFVPTDTSGEPQFVEGGTDVRVVQGYLEGSNVDVAEELVAMIEAQRAYELNSKVIQAADEAMGIAAGLRR